MESIEVKALATGTLIGGAYRVIAPIAEGGMGAIYEVEQVATGARRALKVMHGQFAFDAPLRARFAREARIAASIPSDHVALVLDAGQDEATGALFIVMELLDGSTLSQELRRRGPFGWSPALSILSQIAHALGAAHALGIVHRDLKPANVFLARSRHATVPFTVKLLDFGIAKAVAGESEATAAVLGTPVWMAPEQTTVHEAVGPPTDVWSFGLLTFLVLCGRHYFASGNVKSVATVTALREVILEPLLPATLRANQLSMADRLPPGFDEWFARCVNRELSERFVDARVAFDALARLPAPAGAGEVARGEGWSDRTDSYTDLPQTAIETPRPTGTLSRQRASSATAKSLIPVRGLGAGVTAFGAGLVALAVALFAWWPGKAREDRPAAAAVVPVPAVTSSFVFRMHGSNTIGSDLGPALAEAFLAKRTGSVVVRRRSAPDEMVIEARDGNRVVEAVEIFAHGSSTAFDDIAAGRCDVGMSSRRIHADEIAKLSAFGDLSSAASEHVIALDGLALIVNPTNPVSSLTKEEIAGIFSGQIRTWKDVGGADRSIVVHARDDKSGTYDTFKSLVLGSKPLSPEAVRHESSEELSDAVSADPRAVGFIGLRYVRSAKAVMVQEAGSAPLLPSALTVSTEDYPLARRLYLYIPLAASAVVHDFVDFAQSEEGQRVVQSAGFVDLRPLCDPNAARTASGAREYRDLVRGACRVSTDFRFDKGSTQLDTRALADLQRVVSMTERPEFASRALLLLGFSEASSSRTESLALSRQRAEAVGSQLRARGLHVELERGLGPNALVADDANQEGRERNRRVEVWLR